GVADTVDDILVGAGVVANDQSIAQGGGWIRSSKDYLSDLKGRTGRQLLSDLVEVRVGEIAAGRDYIGDQSQGNALVVLELRELSLTGGGLAGGLQNGEKSYR